MDLAVRNERLAQRVGGVALVVLGVLAVFVIVFDGCTVHRRFRATVYFEHTGGMQEGAEVHVAGRVIGKVTAISLVPVQKVQPGHLLYPGGGVAMTIRIEQRYSAMAPVNGQYFMAPKGLFGERYLEIGVPPGSEPRGRDLRQDDEVRGIDPPRMDRVLLRTHRNLQISRAFAKAIAPDARALGLALDELSATLAQFDGVPGGMSDARTSLGALAREAQALGRGWDSTGVSWSDISGLAERAGQSADRISREIAEIRARVQVLKAALASLGERIPDDLRARFARALNTVETFLPRVDHALAVVRELADMIARGQGTIGALLNDPEFPEQAKDLGRVLKRRPWKLIGRPNSD